ncbi:unnamed protein product [Sphenostylis stenocarpa]|uniref:Uncharacterized protein n=1 Tax=Sphenostylis stenocarpa TaxID=92480 RepID=A0AA86W1X6_9FABA|nr:unnamed protein product [Sphenostylis stenocarpa]
MFSYYLFSCQDITFSWLNYSNSNTYNILKSRSVRDFDDHATRVVGKYESVDTFYRRCSSATYVQSVSVPLLCISALDDPICTTEAIPWDECKANKNILLVTVKHGGHLAFFEGLTASHLWWVRAVNEFLGVLHSNNYMRVQEKISKPKFPLESSIDQGPYVNVSENGKVAAVNNDLKTKWKKFRDMYHDNHNNRVPRVKSSLKR